MVQEGPLLDRTPGLGSLRSALLREAWQAATHPYFSGGTPRGGAHHAEVGAKG